MGLPVRREFPIYTPAPGETGPSWWPAPAPERTAEPRPEPAPAPERGPEEVPA
jgi:hypothetical protein